MVLGAVVDLPMGAPSLCFNAIDYWLPCMTNLTRLLQRDIDATS